ncbi:MAG TPA: hypothetical protein VG406_10285 [Isosphaeraceae bacterium]|jgi:hypothetical protein|nr:hypothetical protein [Isosphaeraceae bacterium]
MLTFARGFGLVLLLAIPGAAARADDAPKLAGSWTWSWKGPDGTEHKHVLEVEGTGAKLAARERFDDLEAVKVNDLKVDGKKVSFSVLRGKRRSEYNGKLDGDDTIDGKVLVEDDGRSNEYTWTAKREKTKKK